MFDTCPFFLATSNLFFLLLVGFDFDPDVLACTPRMRVGDVVLQINGTRLKSRTSAQVEALLGRTLYQVDRCLVLAPRGAPRVAPLDRVGSEAG